MSIHTTAYSAAHMIVPLISFDSMLKNTSDLLIDIPQKRSIFPKNLQPVPDFVFNELEHLDIDLPTTFYNNDLDLKRYEQSIVEDNFAFTEPFKLVSESGVAVLKSIIEKHKTDGRVSQSDIRTPLCLRGLGSVSPFMYELGHSPKLYNLASTLAGEQLAPHSYIMNCGHINVGSVGLNSQIDALHADSVDFVMVVILSNPASLTGGALEVIKMQPLDDAMKAVENGQVTENDILRVAFKHAGECIFMRGSEFLHRVQQVTAGNEPRISCVFSFMRRNVLKTDLTRYRTFTIDPHVHVEYAAHKSRRIARLLKLVEELAFETSCGDVVDVLEKAKNELQYTIDVLTRKVHDGMPYFDEKVQKFCERK
jgi:hypothetical protein